LSLTPRTAALAVGSALLVAAGCTPKGEVLRAELESGARPGRYVPLKFVRQEPNRCGSAALSEVLTHWKAPRSTEAELAAEVYSESLKGTLNADLSAAARRRGMVVRDGPSLLGELRSALADGYPAVVMISVGPHVLKRRHFLAMKAVDTERGYLMADTGSRRDVVFRLRPFRRDWRASKKWALYCWPPDRCPKWSTPAEDLRAGLLLEGRGRLEAAVAAYRRALGKDETFWEAHFNLGNVALARGRREAAVESYRRALALKPGEPDVLNNLAYALFETGRNVEEAERLARRALEKAPSESASRVRAGHTLGVILAARGRREEARKVLTEAVAEAEKVGDKLLAAAARADLENLGKKK
jgi:tetratricopeptide (TPR) repeat protein